MILDIAIICWVLFLSIEFFKLNQQKNEINRRISQLYSFECDNNKNLEEIYRLTCENSNRIEKLMENIERKENNKQSAFDVKDVRFGSSTSTFVGTI